jgi:dihydrofolate reductase
MVPPGYPASAARKPGSNIFVGDLNIPAQLIELGLVDEYHFVVQPILAGEGGRLFEGVNPRDCN